jgi:hypothetical protein
MSRRYRLSATAPEPLFASLTLWERLLLGTAAAWVTFGTPYLLWSLWVIS